jgi:hypothetical protein
MPIDVLVTINLHYMLAVVEPLCIGECHAREYLEQKEIKVHGGVRSDVSSRIFWSLITCSLVRWDADFFSPLVNEPVVWVFSDETETEGFVE